LGGVGGPLLGGLLVGAGLALNSIFYILAGLGLLGLVLTLLVPVAHRPRELRTTVIEPTPSVAARSVKPARTA
jgi:AAHS family benzoate transporter-like MFS transporter